MTTQSIFYFVNADGSGHSRRAEAILPFLEAPVVIVSEASNRLDRFRKGYPVHRIPSLRSTSNRQLADDSLHIPYGRDQVYLERVKSLVDCCQQHQCSLAVIDVCVETAMVMRLCGIPYLYMRMSGKRGDAAHLQTYRAAAGLIASYPQAFEEDWVPQWIRQKTCYVGGILSSHSLERKEKNISQKPYILVMRGKGESRLTSTAIASAASLVPAYRWIGIGFDHPQTGHNFEVLPRIENPLPYVQQAAIVIANTGNNSVLEIGHQAKPMITFPEWRFFDEQIAKATQLSKHNLAVVLTAWPQTSQDWQSVLERANRLNVAAWSEILSDSGAQQAAHYIENQFDALSHSVHTPNKAIPLDAVRYVNAG